MKTLDQIIADLKAGLEDAAGDDSDVAYDVVSRARDDLLIVRSKLYEIL